MTTKQKAIDLLTINGYTEIEAKEELKINGYNKQEIERQYAECDFLN